MAYLFWLLGLVVFFTKDEYFQTIGVSPTGKTLLFFLLSILGVIFHYTQLGRAMRAMIHPVKTLDQAFRKGGDIDEVNKSNRKP